MTKFTETMKSIAYVFFVMYGALSFGIFMLASGTMGKDPTAPSWMVLGIIGMIIAYKATEDESSLR